MSSIITKEEALKRLEEDREFLIQLIDHAKLEAFCLWLKIETRIKKLLRK